MINNNARRCFCKKILLIKRLNTLKLIMKESNKEIKQSTNIFITATIPFLLIMLIDCNIIIYKQIDHTFIVKYRITRTWDSDFDSISRVTRHIQEDAKQLMRWRSNLKFIFLKFTQDTGCSLVINLSLPKLFPIIYIFFKYHTT